MSLKNVRITISNQASWSTVQPLPEVMVATKPSIPDPNFAYHVTGLNPDAFYQVSLILIPEGTNIYRYDVDEKSLKHVGSDPNKLTRAKEILLPYLPGSDLLEHGITFPTLRFTTKPDLLSSVKMAPLLKYSTTVLITLSDGSSTEFSDPCQDFVCVTKKSPRYTSNRKRQSQPEDAWVEGRVLAKKMRIVEEEDGGQAKLHGAVQGVLVEENGEEDEFADGLGQFIGNEQVAGMNADVDGMFEAFGDAQGFEGYAQDAGYAHQGAFARLPQEPNGQVPYVDEEQGFAQADFIAHGQLLDQAWPDFEPDQVQANGRFASPQPFAPAPPVFYNGHEVQNAEFEPLNVIHGPVNIFDHQFPAPQDPQDEEFDDYAGQVAQDPYDAQDQYGFQY